MLGTLRAGSKNLFVKSFLFILAMAFVVWGVGDIFRGKQSDLIVKFDGVGISNAEFSNAYNSEVQRFSAASGSKLTDQQLKDIGFKNFVLQKLINVKLLSKRASDLDLAVNLDVINNRIKQYPVFFNAQGKFDKDLFMRTLSSNGISEKEFISSIKSEEAKAFLSETLLNSNLGTEAIATALLQFQNEMRVMDIVTVPANYQVVVPEPTEEELLQFHTKRPEFFQIPEVRSFSYIIIDPAINSGQLSLTDEELKKEYQNRLDEFAYTEQRQVLQYVFDNEQEANEAYDKLVAGIKLSSEPINMGYITSAGLPEEVFKTDINQYSKPISSDFGYHIFIAKDQKPEGVKSFDEVKSVLKDELVSEKSGELFQDYLSSLEDSFASGTSLEDVAKNNNLELMKVNSVTISGNNQQGNLVKLDDTAKELLKEAFSLEASIESAPIATADGKYAIIRVDNIVPTRIKALDEARGVAINQLKKKLQIDALQKVAEEVSGELQKSGDFNKLDNKDKLQIVTNKEVRRSDLNYEDPVNNVLMQLFSGKKGEWSKPVASIDGSFVIGRVNEIISSKETKGADVNDMKSALSQVVSQELMQQYAIWLRKHYNYKPSDINNELLDKYN